MIIFFIFFLQGSAQSPAFVFHPRSEHCSLTLKILFLLFFILLSEINVIYSYSQTQTKMEQNRSFSFLIAFPADIQLEEISRRAAKTNTK